jgi:hypothetical protein
MAESTEKKPFYKKWWVWVIAVIILGAIGSQQGGDEDAPGERAKLADDPVILKRPDQQKNFVIITQEARKSGADAKNDMQRGGYLNTRGKEICNTLNSLVVKDWTGWVKSVDSNSEGQGVLSIRLARDIHVQTWNNALSDIAGNTLIKPGSKLFQSASSLETGAKVKFSGSFIKDDKHCIEEQSMSLSGKIDDPEFSFRFSSIELLK